MPKLYIEQAIVKILDRYPILNENYNEVQYESQDLKLSVPASK